MAQNLRVGHFLEPAVREFPENGMVSKKPNYLQLAKSSCAINGGAIFANVSWSKLLLITVLVSYKLHQRSLKSWKRG